MNDFLTDLENGLHSIHEVDEVIRQQVDPDGESGVLTVAMDDGRA